MLVIQPFNDYEDILIQLIKFGEDTISTTIGINLWFAPQISEH
jgi:hypothetical protein